MKPKNICPNCGHIETEKNTWKKAILALLKSTFTIFVVFTSIVGTTSIYNFIRTTNGEPELVFSIGQFYAFINNFQNYFQSAEEKQYLSKIADNLTKSCDADDDYCKAYLIYSELSEFDYLEENATDLNPIHTWEAREGDCDMMSILFVRLLKTQNIKSMLSCSTTHCWTVVFLKNPEKTIKVDITGEGWVE